MSISPPPPFPGYGATAFALLRLAEP
jgi:hypothetical protein